MIKRFMFCFILILCLCGCNKEETTETTVSTEQSTTEVFRSGYYVTLDGYEFIIDKNYQVYNSDNNVYFDAEGKFSSKLSVINRSFEEYKNDLTILENNILENNGTVLIAPCVTRIDDNTYVSAKFELNGIENYIIVSGGSLDDCLVIQMSLESDMSAADLFKTTRAILDSAKRTSMSDTTTDELEAQRSMLSNGQNKASSSIELDDCVVQFKCPTGVHSIDVFEDEYYVMENFQRLADSLYVTVMLYEPVDGEPLSAKEYVDFMVESQNDDTISAESITYNDRTFYYYSVESINTDGTKNHDIEFVTDVGDGYIYYVAMHKLASDESINIENLMEFLDIQVQ